VRNLPSNPIMTKRQIRRQQREARYEASLRLRQEPPMTKVAFLVVGFCLMCSIIFIALLLYVAWAYTPCLGLHCNGPYNIISYEPRI
jgi:hypothetical protein